MRTSTLALVLLLYHAAAARRRDSCVTRRDIFSNAFDPASRGHFSGRPAASFFANTDTEKQAGAGAETVLGP
jgi:hypothetical protein